MPLLNRKYAGIVTSPNGQQIQIPPAHALLAQGPVIDIQIGVSSTLAQYLNNNGTTVPTPISGLALIDTGASTTCIDSTIPIRLGINPVGTGTMATPSSTGSPMSLYPVKLDVIGFQMTVELPHAAGVTLNNQGIIALIGRDFLQNCTLIYNGFTWEITLGI